MIEGYYDLHHVCPRCGKADNYQQTCVGVLGDKDTNQATCICGWVGIVHDLISCDHEWEVIDESFDHELGCEQIVFERCKLCDEEREYQLPTFEDDVI